MAKTNLTLQLDEEVIRRARIVAAKRGTSVSALVARELAGRGSRPRNWSVAFRQLSEFRSQVSQAAST